MEEIKPMSRFFCVFVCFTALLSLSFGANSQTVYTSPTTYSTAISGLGASSLVNFDELNASPNNGTIIGRTPFAGNAYLPSTGISFASPTGIDLYIAPKNSSAPDGTIWNLSNSLSVGRFPYDPAPGGDLDSLTVKFTQGQSAVGFSLVGSTSQFAEFYDASNHLILTVNSPTAYAFNRKFYGVVSTGASIFCIKVIDNVSGNDITYDDFQFVPTGGTTGSPVPEPGAIAFLASVAVVALSSCIRNRKKRVESI